MSEYGEFAQALAREAGALLKERFHGPHRVAYKGAINLVTETDTLSEELIISRITGAFPEHDILAEESSPIRKGSSYRWIIDPLDGTTNFAHGFPQFCVSIAFEKEGRIILGVIYDPLLDELFIAEKGAGAFLNERRLVVSDTKDLSKSLLATGFPYDIRTNPDNNINYFNELALKVQAIRRAGSAALDLAYLAAGRFDGFWELKLHPWDTAAGWLMVEEAGGIVTGIDGGGFYLESPGIAASNGHIQEALLSVLRETDPLDHRLVR
ncbi:MAG: inositol monophosphatase [Deltaproteobacteria bacterium]|nr:inositol monophosphatase [Deltaproteobacteria bacterium]